MKRIHWPTALVLVVAIVAVVVVVFFGIQLGVPADLHADVVGALALVAMPLLAWLRGALSRDADRDGVPDALQDSIPPTNPPTKNGGAS